MIARLAILYRRPDLTREEFQTYWKNTHAPLARDIPGLRRYVQHHVIGAAAREPVSPHPRIVESSRPTHTPVTKSREKPMNHASF